ncbi:MAG TPA: pirin family protein [Planctomycetota bacterium]|nr:pirin family protein [Planctomycetota bacterium]
MITIRNANDRGHARHGWLDSRHTFSFADYHDPDQMGYRTLRVINEDRVEPGQGFGTHPHRDMEILSYVLEGSLEHKDSMGTSSVIRPGEVQRMSAGTGVLHSEYNPSDSEPVHFLQIWILPDRKNLKPGYEQKTFPEEERRNRLRLVASRNGREGSLTIHQDVDVYSALLSKGGKAKHVLKPGRFSWVQVARGNVSLNGQILNPGDGASVSGEKALELGSAGDAEVLLFDLA